MFQCVGMLAAAVGPNLTKLLHDQLDLMFAYGLSEPLRQALVAIATHIPPLLKTIQGTHNRAISNLCSVHNKAGTRPTLGYAVIHPQRTALSATWRATFVTSQ